MLLGTLLRLLHLLRPVLAWVPALIAGYSAALIANLVVWHGCGAATCLQGSVLSSASGLASIATVCWFVRCAHSRRKRVLACVAVTLLIALWNAPLTAREPMSWAMTRFPADFVALGLLQIPLRVLTAASSITSLTYLMLFLVPFLAVAGLCGAMIRVPTARSSQAGDLGPLAALTFLALALGLEIWTTASAWRPSVHRRIANFEIGLLPGGTDGEVFRAWARQELHFSERTGVSSVLDFYERVFRGWQRLDRSSQDAFWIDPTKTVIAWVAIPGTTQPEDQSATHYVSISLIDVDRGLGQHQYRRTSSGQLIGALIAGSR